MLELARSSVQTWECDQMGHMNVQFYVEKAMDGLSAFAIALGIGPRHLASEGLVLRPADQHIRFLRELRPGTPYFLRGGAVSAAPDRLIHYSELVQSADQTVSAAFRTEAVLTGRDGRGRDFPPAALAAAARYPLGIPAHGAARGLELVPARAVAPTLAEAETLGLVATFEGAVRPSECDASGAMLPRHFMARVSDSIPNLLVRTPGRNRGEAGGTGGAALEYRFVYRGQPQAGDILCVRSGLRAIGAKTYIWVHWLFDVESGRCVATADAVAVALDLQTRKAIALPDDLRERLETLVIEGLSV